MVTAMPTVLQHCAEQAAIADKYLSTTPRASRQAELAAAWAESPRSRAAPPRPAARAPSLPGAREDGCIGLWLEKKSPSVVKGWQRRWFVINPRGQLQYFTDPSKEELGDRGKQKKGQTLYLADCTRVTSNNMESGHFELHFPTANKMIELRVEDKTRESLAIIEEIFAGLKNLGALSPANDGKLHQQTALEQLGVTSGAPARDVGLKI